jgi:hypothetical protein
MVLDSTSAGARPMTPALEGGRVEAETRWFPTRSLKAKRPI